MASGNIQSTTKAEKLHAACIEILGDSEISFLNETTLLIVIAASNNLAGIEFEKGIKRCNQSPKIPCHSASRIRRCES
jgi:hypothetical protein